MNRVFLLGAFPPPVHGAAAVTEHIAKLLEVRGNAQRLEVGPDSLKRDVRYHLQRVVRVAGALRTLKRARLQADDAVYIAVSGGLGAFYDLLMGVLARRGKARLFLHHHSFAYLDRRSHLMAAVAQVCGSSACHICLCEEMAVRLRERYSAVQQTLVVSNAAFSSVSEEARHTSAGSLVIGHMSNLSREKGLQIALEVGAQCVDVIQKFVVAGPANGDALALLDEYRPRFGNKLDYRGPVHGTAKGAFFADIDIFVFPTLYRNEAEPLVVQEAMAAGVPVVAYARGCIASQVPDGCGMIVEPGKDFRGPAIAWIRNAASDAEFLDQARLTSRRIAAERIERSGENLSVLLQRLSG